ncbi:MAG: hypothetical protein EA428_04700 [Spirochaetaceae bacterium]|nr:MAG: hypothetical protein EA428_04700 [Spirochaetaceae bacterium]
MQSVRQNAFLVLVAVFLAGPVIAAQAVEKSISLDYIMTNREPSTTVNAARLRYDAARISAEAAAVGADPGFSITPTAKLSGDEGETDPNKATVTASFGLTVPLGLTAEQRSRAMSALERVSTLDAALAEAQLKDIQEIVGLYHTAYLAQRELEVGQLELEAIRLQRESDRVRFERGDLRFSDFLRSENDFSNAEADVASASAELREAVLKLSVATGMRVDLLGALAAPPLIYESNGPSQDLSELGGTSVGYSLDSSLLSRYYGLQAAERETEQRPSFFSFAQARASLDYMDHAASVSLNPASRILGLSYTPEGIVLRDDAESSSTGSGGSGSSDSDWSLTLSVSFALSPARVETHDYESRQLAVEQARLELADEEQRIEDIRRAAELEMLKTNETVQSFIAAVERAEINLEMVLAQDRAQRALPVDVRAAEAALERALLGLERIELLRDQKFLERFVPTSDSLRILSAPATWRTE